jgi:tetratricopeptide (TPR) repeat protein
MRKTCLAFAACGIVLVAFLPAQFQGRIEGKVTDAAGTPLEKVEVSIVSVKTSTMHFESTTDKDGKFFQVGLMPGYFQISFKKSGFMPKSTEVKVSIAEATRIEVKLDTADQLLMKSVSEADRIFLRGNKLYAEMKYAEAATAYQESIKLTPTNWGYYLNLGLAFKKMDKREEALAAFRTAAQLAPESFSANKELGEALAKAGSFEEAKTYYLKAVALSPDDPDAHYNLGACLLNTGEQETAIGHFQKTIELKPDYAEAYYQLGTLYVGQNKVPEAIQSLEKFLSLAPNHPQAQVAKQLLEYLKK